MKLPIGIKTIYLLGEEKLHLFYANNKGRGSDNVTIIKTKEDRYKNSKDQIKNCISWTRISHWGGVPYLSKEKLHLLGLDEKLLSHWLRFQ